MNEANLEEIPLPDTFTTIQVVDPSVTAFMMYTDLANNVGVYSVLRAKRSWGWLLRWQYSDGTQIDVHVESTLRKDRNDA